MTAEVGHSGPLNWTQACALRAVSEHSPAWVYGWNIARRNTLEALARRGLVEMRAVSLDTEYRITYAGNVYLEEHPVVFHDD